ACGDWSAGWTCGDDGCGGTCPACSQTYGPGATCAADDTCTCPSPGFQCLALLYGIQCCSADQTCDNFFGCVES
ncbi:MAG TPA: hypothetical protein P5076_03680, partial [Myxococcota bacterium]|nr:hypothetical protein [Myxococcota bacterium]